MTGLRIVPSVATEEMGVAVLKAPFNEKPIWVTLADAGLDVRFIRAIYAAAIAAAPALTDEQIDALCRAMWGHEPWWKEPPSGSEGVVKELRDGNRDRMRNFIRAIQEPQP